MNDIPFIQIFVKLIEKEKSTIIDVPENIKDKVEEIIENK